MLIECQQLNRREVGLYTFRLLFYNLKGEKIEGQIKIIRCKSRQKEILKMKEGQIKKRKYRSGQINDNVKSAYGKL